MAELVVYFRQNQMFVLLFEPPEIIEQDQGQPEDHLSALKIFLDKNLILKGRADEIVKHFIGFSGVYNLWHIKMGYNLWVLQCVSKC